MKNFHSNDRVISYHLPGYNIVTIIEFEFDDDKRFLYVEQTHTR